MTEPLRLSKRMSELGLCSRREADEWIARGWVRVDGKVVSELGSKVLPSQRITVERQRYIETVQDYNTYIRKFPVNLTAMMFGHERKPNFTVENEAQISNAPTVDFGTPPPVQMQPAPQAPPVQVPPPQVLPESQPGAPMQQAPVPTTPQPLPPAQPATAPATQG